MNLEMSSEVAGAHGSECSVVNCSSCSPSKTNNSFSFHLVLSLWWELFLRSVGAFAVLHAIIIYGPEFCFASQTRAPYLCWMQNIINISTCFELISRFSVNINWHNFVGDSGGKCWHALDWHFTSSYCINWLQKVQAAFENAVASAVRLAVLNKIHSVAVCNLWTLLLCHIRIGIEPSRENIFPSGDGVSPPLRRLLPLCFTACLLGSGFCDPPAGGAPLLLAPGICSWGSAAPQHGAFSRRARGKRELMGGSRFCVWEKKKLKH